MAGISFGSGIGRNLAETAAFQADIARRPIRDFEERKQRKIENATRLFGQPLLKAIASGDQGAVDKITDQLNAIPEVRGLVKEELDFAADSTGTRLDPLKMMDTVTNMRRRVLLTAEAQADQIQSTDENPVEAQLPKLNPDGTIGFDTVGVTSQAFRNLKEQAEKNVLAEQTALSKAQNQLELEAGRGLEVKGQQETSAQLRRAELDPGKVVVKDPNRLETLKKNKALADKIIVDPLSGEETMVLNTVTEKDSKALTGAQNIFNTLEEGVQIMKSKGLEPSIIGKFPGGEIFNQLTKSPEWQAWAAKVDKNFDLWRKQITGAQASFQELRALEGRLPTSRDASSESFISKSISNMQDWVRAYETDVEALQGRSFDTTPFEGKVEFNKDLFTEDEIKRATSEIEKSSTQAPKSVSRGHLESKLQGLGGSGVTFETVEQVEPSRDPRSAASERVELGVGDILKRFGLRKTRRGN
jgi:hypothetical protein